MTSVEVYRWIVFALWSVVVTYCVVSLARNPPLYDDDDYRGHGVWE